MRQRRRPPAPLLAAVLALVAGGAGTALAADPAANSAAKELTKKKAKKIATKQATKQINKLAPGLSVGSAQTAASAEAAGSADTAATANSANTATSANVASSLSGVERVSATSTFNSDTRKFADVSCPAGKRAVGGGGSISAGLGSPPPEVALFYNTVDTTGWSAGGVETAPIGANWRVNVVAICARY